MTEHSFKIFLDDKLIGTTLFEKADVPMGVVFGQIEFTNIDNAYTFFKAYCLQNQIGITDYKQDKFLTTRHISNLKVFDSDNTEIKGSAVSVSGQGNKDFEITVEGVPQTIFSFKFKHHIDHYKNLFDQYIDKDNISEIGIDDKERLFIKPEKATFPLIYRTATEVHWDDKNKFLYSPKPNEWTYLDWYKQIIGVVETECNYKLKLKNATKWTNISDDLKKQIIEA
jgi:Integron Cassette Protein Hfx_Cass5